MAVLNVFAEENARTEERLYHFLREHTDDQVQRQVLLFWAMHPNTKFSRLAIRCAVDCGKLDVDRALRALVVAGLLIKHADNGLTLYSLTTDEKRQQLIMEMATLGWDRWQLILRRMEQGESLSEHERKAGGK